MSTLKEQLFNRETVTKFATMIKNKQDGFDINSFVDEAIISFNGKELKERMTVITKLLDKYLGSSYEDNINLFYRVLEGSKEGMFVYGSIFEYIEIYGLEEKYKDISLQAIRDLTKYFTGEFAIRSFINKYPIDTIKLAVDMSLSTDFHQRRLASEGYRPSLPWAKNIMLDYKIASKHLDHLYFDSERYVVRSVANHLNDISKIDPGFTISKLKEWKQSNKQSESEMNYLINHALRTLIKKGNKEALDFLGFNLNHGVRVITFECDKKVSIGEDLHFKMHLVSNKNVKIIIDYIIYYKTKHNRVTNKTYKYKTMNIEKEEEVILKGKRSFKPITTRNFTKGTHQIEIQINGEKLNKIEFELI